MFNKCRLKNFLAPFCYYLQKYSFYIQASSILYLLKKKGASPYAKAATIFVWSVIIFILYSTNVFVEFPIALVKFVYGVGFIGTICNSLLNTCFCQKNFEKIVLSYFFNIKLINADCKP